MEAIGADNQDDVKSRKNSMEASVKRNTSLIKSVDRKNSMEAPG